jgi:hypothetical protein
MHGTLANLRHERFAQALARGKTATEAYLLAGYKANDGNASRMKGNERISARVEAIVGRAAERAEVSLERVLRELKAIAFSDISKAVTWGPSVQVREEEEDGPRAAAARRMACRASGRSKRSAKALIICDFKEMDRLPMATGFSAIQNNSGVCPKDLVRDWRHSRPQGR